MGDSAIKFSESLDDPDPYILDPSMSDSDPVLPSTVQQLWVDIGLPLLIFGTIQHALSLLVLLGSRRMRSLSLSVYLVASALSGLAALYVGLLRQILLRLDGYEKDVRSETTDVGCRLHAALTYFSLQLFSWLQASVAVERFISVWRPLQYHHWCTGKRNLIIVLVITIILASLNIIVIDSYTLDETNRCTPWKRFLFDNVWGSIDLVLFSLVPIAVMVPCNIMTVLGILRSQAYKRNKNFSVSHRRSTQFTAMLLVHNVVCVLTTLPISVIFLMPGWSHISGSTESNARITQWTVFSLLQYLGTTLDFTVYSILAQKFRQATRDLFCKGFYARVTSLDSTSHISLHSTAGHLPAARQEWEQGGSVHGDVGDKSKDLPLDSSRLVRQWAPEG